MLNRKKTQLNMWDMVVFEKLIPTDHLLVKIDSLIDFSFVYEVVKGNYKDGIKGRSSYDPVILFKLCLLEYIYCLSDVKIIERSRTDVAFRWFLCLSLDDKLPDDSTISYFRVHRLGSANIELIFNEIVKKCISNKFIKKHRYIVDSTDVEANTNYPSDKKLIIQSFRNLLKEVQKFNPALAFRISGEFEKQLANRLLDDEKLTLNDCTAIAKEHLDTIHKELSVEIDSNKKLADKYVIIFRLIKQYEGKSSDKIVSYVDPDARIAHKSPGKIKKGYKDHIIVDEDSEIILSSIVTPFNVNDHKELIALVKKSNSLNLKPKELTADKAYGTTENRVFLYEQNMIANISFYTSSSRETKFGLEDFEISRHLNLVVCPNDEISTDYYFSKRKKGGDRIVFKFEKNQCLNCPLKNDCLRENEKQKKYRIVEVPTEYKIIINDRDRNNTPEFKESYNKRYKVERRFATLVRNHNMRRCRYLKIEGAKIHIYMSNMACNIIRMVHLSDERHHPEKSVA